MSSEIINKVAWCALALLVFVKLAGDGGSSSAPIKVDGLRVAIIEEQSDRIKPEHIAIVGSTELRQLVKSKSGEMRVIDKDADLSKDAQWVRDAFAVPRQSLPWAVIASPKGGCSIPAASLDTILAETKKWGG